ncbi:MAG TPA: TIGR01777 family oxidoreductase [Kofleriaceae bacterium]|nr:TIGR01777 family oxidoreductase [Kofleriaceae bacterium]
MPTAPAIVVTGATGFVGTALVAALRAAGHPVTVLARDADRARGLLGDVTAVAADLQSPGAWTAALAGAAAIVHLAGEPIDGHRWDARHKQRMRDSRIETTRTLVEAIAALPAAARPGALIGASGADYYPFAPDTEFDDDEVTERDPPSDSFLGRLCRDWETEARAAEPLGLRVVAMRTGVVLGPGGALARMAAPFRMFVGGRIGSGRQWLSWIHRDDAAGAYLAAVADPRYTGPINLVTDSVRNAALADAIGRALHRPSWLPVPGFALRAAIGELAEYALHGRRVVPARLRELGFTWQRPTLEAALAIPARTSGPAGSDSAATP